MHSRMSWFGLETSTEGDRQSRLFHGLGVGASGSVDEVDSDGDRMQDFSLVR